MERYYYALLDDTVYVFEKKKQRDRFCTEKLAKRIYAYERHKYRTHVFLSETHKNTSKSNETQSVDSLSVNSQNVKNRYVSERQKMFKGQR